MIAPSTCKSEAVSRNIRAICLLSMPAIIFLSPSCGTGTLACALGVPLLRALRVPTSVSSVLNPFPSPTQKKRRKLWPPPSDSDTNSLSGAFFHLGRLRSFGSLYYLEFDRITLLQRPVAITVYRRVVYEYIGPILPAYESVSFRIIEPLYCSLHFVSPLDGDSGGGIPRRAAMSTNCAECIKLEFLVKQTLSTFFHPCAYLYGFQTVQTVRAGKPTAKK